MPRTRRAHSRTGHAHAELEIYHSALAFGRPDCLRLRRSTRSLDKGLIIDVHVRVSLVGIENLTIDARIVIASVDTYLRFAAAVNRLDLTETEADLLEELTGA